MKYDFKLASESMLDEIYNLILKRIKWMDEVGIKQWNVTHYTDAFPKSYFKDQIEKNHLYVITKDNKVKGAIVILEKDNLWTNEDIQSVYYLHNLVTDLNEKGLGKIIIELTEKMAKEKGIEKLRLDCSISNEFLNNYYEELGYHFVGTVNDGPYVGNKREKIIK